jgi:ubiquinone/menaquinone biosynthesis C-methylase UbiE
MINNFKNITEVWKVYANAYENITPSYQKELLTYAGSKMNKKVLDLGTGVGKIIPYLNKYKEFLGIDNNIFMLDKAKKYENEKTHFLRFDLENDNWKKLGFYDSIVSLNVIYTLKNVDKFLWNVFRILEKGGVGVISSQKPKLNPKLETVLYEEFKESNYLKDFIECNKFLVGFYKDFKPTVLETDEIKYLLKSNGFSILENIDNFYLGSNFTVYFKKN